ncbi:KamA family radical SAM protein [Dulcicalothrix desertica PCC 7102]|uniref:KamA family radical SAM protein n=1 Tax=Dulcicalothrix desertica PCC 7102 TaxID=232991 RepID=A0A3S1D7X4_9CYAN|nr:KamA family radical SAM protein [Dulcicalothrix desertica]RUT05165.1 KamA family radical SAM protein [Dulcicalothrix desertica PCC 7102]TWH43329.1 KamA family protein [Dulcicalothrix desertica PCC 7102]
MKWKEELIESIKMSQQAESVLPLSTVERARISQAKQQFPMMVPVGYADLVDWENPDDPLRQLLLPSEWELDDAGSFDTSGEEFSTVVQGLQHKYHQTAVLIVTQACAGHCRYCFRRRLMSRDILVKETIEDLQEAIAYISVHPEIDNVLLSGGDPMICHTNRLKNILKSLAAIPHIWQVRISSKLPAFLPSRFTSDPELLEVLQAYQSRFQIVIQCHYDHPRELTLASIEALEALQKAGCLLTSQIALMKGVNNSVDTLTELFKRLHRYGVIPQYLFHPRPVKHATHFQFPIVYGIELVEAVRKNCNGSVKRFRYILTHADGKLELVGIIPGASTQLVTKWQQVRIGVEKPELMLVNIDKDTCWLDN